MTIHNVRKVLERLGGIQPNQTKYVFAPKVFCEECQRNVAETRLHPIQRTKKLHATTYLSATAASRCGTHRVSAGNVTMMEPLTLRGARGGLTTTDQSDAEQTYRARVITFGGNVAEHSIRYTIHNGINGIKNEGKHIKNTKRLRKPKSMRSKSVHHGIDLCVQRALLSSLQVHTCPVVDSSSSS